jgi:hypothetical protein
MPGLEGKRVLVVVSDVARGRQLAEALRRGGATVLGPAPTAYYALSLLGHGSLNAAFFDIPRDDEMERLLARLSAQEVRWGYARRAGYGDGQFAGRPSVEAPYGDDEVLTLLSKLLAETDSEEPPLKQASADTYVMEHAILEVLGSKPRPHSG